MTAPRERGGVDRDGAAGEHQREPEAPSAVDAPLPGEVAGEQRQHEEAGVQGVEGVLAEPAAEQLGDLHGERRGDREAEDDGDLRAGRPRPVSLTVRLDDELFPEPLRVLAGEFARHRVQAAHALDGDQERFFPRQAGLDQRRDLVAKMALELVDVRRPDRRPAEQPGAPLRDLGFEDVRRCGHVRVPPCRAPPAGAHPTRVPPFLSPVDAGRAPTRRPGRLPGPPRARAPTRGRAPSPARFRAALRPPPSSGGAGSPGGPVPGR